MCLTALKISEVAGRGEGNTIKILVTQPFNTFTAYMACYNTPRNSFMFPLIRPVMLAHSISTFGFNPLRGVIGFAQAKASFDAARTAARPTKLDVILD